jgi:Uma2 family endonuclease
MCGPSPKKTGEDDTVVQPGILVVCDPAKLSKDSVDGPPDLIIEIASPSNSQQELFLKFQIYLDAGVREYWVIDPEKREYRFMSLTAAILSPRLSRRMRLSP